MSLTQIISSSYALMMFTTFTTFSAFTMFTKISKNLKSALYRALSTLVITKLPTQPSWKTGQFYFCVITPPAGTKTTAFTTQLMQISRPGKMAFTASRLKWSHRSHHSLGKVGFRGRHVFHGMKETYQSVH